MSAAGEAPVAFDAAAFVSDLVAAGVMVVLVRDVPRGGEKAKPPSYFVRSQDGQGLGSASAYDAVMERWRPAMTACPDYRDRVIEHLTSRPIVFDPAAFVADLRVAGCRVVLSTPGTCFKPGDEVATYFIAPADGRGFGDAYSDVMLRWHEAMANHPDPIGAVVAHLTAAWEAGA